MDMRRLDYLSIGAGHINFYYYNENGQCELPNASRQHMRPPHIEIIIEILTGHNGVHTQFSCHANECDKKSMNRISKSKKKKWNSNQR